MPSKKGFKNYVDDGELDRQLIDLEPSDKSIYRAVTAHASEKNLTFTSFSHEYSPWLKKHGPEKYAGVEQLPRKIQILFKKVCNGKDDFIEIEVKKWTRLKAVRRCSLGHAHDEHFVDFDVWERMNISWINFEELLSWFQTGRYYDPRTKQAKKHGGSFHSAERVE